MSGLVILLEEDLSPDTQKHWTGLIGECGFTCRVLNAQRIHEVQPQDVVAIVCSLAPGQRQLPSDLETYRCNTTGDVPFIVALAQEDLIEPIMSLEDGKILLLAPSVPTEQQQLVLLHLMRQHPMSFSSIDEEAGEVQADHSSMEWWVSCRREAHSAGEWPWARVDSERIIECGLASQPTIAIDESSAPASSNSIRFDPANMELIVDSVPATFGCWLLNEKRWPACHRIATEEEAPTALTCVSGDIIILSNREELINDSIEHKIPAVLKQAANERIGSSVLLEVR